MYNNVINTQSILSLIMSEEEHVFSESSIKLCLGLYFYSQLRFMTWVASLLNTVSKIPCCQSRTCFFGPWQAEKSPSQLPKDGEKLWDVDKRTYLLSMSGQGQGSQNSLEGLEETWPWSRRTQTQRSPSCQCEFRTMTNGAKNGWCGKVGSTSDNPGSRCLAQVMGVLFRSQCRCWITSWDVTCTCRRLLCCSSSYALIDVSVIKSVVSVAHIWGLDVSPTSPLPCRLLRDLGTLFLVPELRHQLPRLSLASQAVLPQSLGLGWSCLPFFCVISFSSLPLLFCWRKRISPESNV